MVDLTMLMSALALALGIFAWYTWINPWIQKTTAPPPVQQAPSLVTAPITSGSSNGGATPTPGAPTNGSTGTAGSPGTPPVAGPAGGPVVEGPAGGPAEPTATDLTADLDAGAPQRDIPVEVQTGRIDAVVSTLGGALRSYNIAEPRPLPGDDPRLTLLDALERKSPDDPNLYDRMSLSVSEVRYKFSAQDDWTIIPNFQLRTYRVVPFNGQAVEDGVYKGLPAKIVTLETRTPLFTLQRKFVFFRNQPDPKAPGHPTQRDHLDSEISITSTAGKEMWVSYKMSGPAGILPDGPKSEPVSRYNLSMGRVFSMTETKGAFDTRKLTQADLLGYEKAKSTDNLTSGDLNLWTGVQDRFFCSVLIPYDPRQDPQHPDWQYTFYADPIHTNWLYHDPTGRNLRYGGDAKMPVLESETGVIRERSLENGKTATDAYALYVGPLWNSYLKHYDPLLTQKPAGLKADQTLELDQNIEYSRFSWLDYLSRGLVWFLDGLHWLTGSFGLSVILMTVMIKMLMFPLSKRTVVSMEKMKLLQPYMAALKKLYEGKDDQASKQKMSQEMMALYRMNKASPFGSCMPMFFTLWIFLALYDSFWANYSMRHVGFLGIIQDMCEPDHTFPIYLDHIASFMTHWFNLLPFLYLGLNYLQLAFAPQPGTADANAGQMKFVTKLMPLFMLYIFYSAPSGLVLYFDVSMAYGLAENFLIRKFLYKPTPVEAPAHLKKMVEKLAAEKRQTAQAGGLSVAAQG